MPVSRQMLESSIGILTQVLEGKDYSPDDATLIAECQDRLLTAIREGQHEDLAAIHAAFADGRAHLRMAVEVVAAYLAAHAEDVEHSVGKTAKELKDERGSTFEKWNAHATAAEKIAHSAWLKEVSPEMKNSRDRMLRSITSTDFPSKADILFAVREVYPELEALIPDPQTAPKKHSSMWEEAGLSHVRQAQGSPQHPNIAKRVEELKALKKRGAI